MSNVYAAPTADLSGEQTGSETTPFAINGRIGRLRYLAYGTASYFLVSFAIGLLMIPLVISGKGDMTPPSEVVMTVTIWIAMMAVFVVIARRRLHDLGMSGWFVLGCFIPFVNFYFALIMLFKRGDEGNNEFGSEPSDNTWGVKVLAGLLPLIAIIGIIAAILIPQLK